MDTEQDLSRTTLCNEEISKEDFPDADSREHELSWFPSRSKLYNKSLIALGLITVLTLIILYFTIPGWARLRAGTKIDQCGTTAEEARTRGCVFEATGFSWVTKECYDPTVEEEFIEYITANEVKLFRDTNYTEEVPIEEVRLGNVRTALLWKLAFKPSQSWFESLARNWFVHVPKT